MNFKKVAFKLYEKRMFSIIEKIIILKLVKLKMQINYYHKFQSVSFSVLFFEL